MECFLVHCVQAALTQKYHVRHPPHRPVLLRMQVNLGAQAHKLGITEYEKNICVLYPPMTPIVYEARGVDYHHEEWIQFLSDDPKLCQQSVLPPPNPGAGDPPGRLPATTHPPFPGTPRTNQT